jgi:hypothetical protein
MFRVSVPFIVLIFGLWFVAPGGSTDQHNQDCHKTETAQAQDTCESISIYINKNVNIRLYKILNLRKFFTDCFEIFTQRCIRIHACLYIPTVAF